MTEKAKAIFALRDYCVANSVIIGDCGVEMSKFYAHQYCRDICDNPSKLAEWNQLHDKTYKVIVHAYPPRHDNSNWDQSYVYPSSMSRGEKL